MRRPVEAGHANGFERLVPGTLVAVALDLLARPSLAAASMTTGGADVRCDQHVTVSIDHCTLTACKQVAFSVFFDTTDCTLPGKHHDDTDRGAIDDLYARLEMTVPH